MLNKIKHKIKEFENRIDINYQFNHDQIALTQLLKMFDNNIFFPITTWSISPKEVLHICNDIIINNRENIIEFGTGFSTICIAQLLKINNLNVNFYSIESSEEWADKVLINLKKLNLDKYVKIIVSPIDTVTTEFAIHNQTKWYDVDVLNLKLKDIKEIDLIIVDGPYGGITPFARYSAVPYLKEKIHDNFTVFLDDFSRNTEREIGNVWAKILNGNLTDHKRYACINSTSSFGAKPYGNR